MSIQMSSVEVMARARALPANAPRSVREMLLSQLLRASAFEDLVVKEGSEEAANAALARMTANALAVRAREIAFISGPAPSRPSLPVSDPHPDHRTSQGATPHNLRYE